jgi:hypothetical protein
MDHTHSLKLTAIDVCRGNKPAVGQSIKNSRMIRTPGAATYHGYADR